MLMTAAVCALFFSSRDPVTPAPTRATILCPAPKIASPSTAAPPSPAAPTAPSARRAPGTSHSRTAPACQVRRGGARMRKSSRTTLGLTCAAGAHGAGLRWRRAKAPIDDALPACGSWESIMSLGCRSADSPHQRRLLRPGLAQAHGHPQTRAAPPCAPCPAPAQSTAPLRSVRCASRAARFRAAPAPPAPTSSASRPSLGRTASQVSRQRPQACRGHAALQRALCAPFTPPTASSPSRLHCAVLLYVRPRLGDQLHKVCLWLFAQLDDRDVLHG